MRFYSVRWDYDYHVGVTTDGRDWVPLGVVFDKPKPAIRYADMRQANVSPLRASDEVTSIPVLVASSKSLTGLPAGAGVSRPRNPASAVQTP